MSNIDRFLAKPVKKTISGVELEFKPLTVNDLGMLMDLEDVSKRAEVFKKLMNKYIDELFPDATKEEKSQFSLEFLKDFSAAIMEVNNLSKEDVETATKPTSPKKG